MTLKSPSLLLRFYKGNRYRKETNKQTKKTADRNNYSLVTAKLPKGF